MAIPSLSILALIVGLLIAAAGNVLLLVKAFQKSLGWGFATLFLPFANLVFACANWEKAKLGFLILAGGLAVSAGGACTMPELKTELLKKYPLPPAVATAFPSLAPPATPAPNPTVTLNAQIQQCRTQLESLQGLFAQEGPELAKQYQALEAQRKALKSKDTAAITKFNEAAAAYQARNTARRQMQQQIDATQRQIDDLLDARTRTAASPAAGKGKNVVMYTTSHCPACKAAKQYLAQKNVPFQEIDVETSRDGQAAFQKLGGHGVPLIIVGDKRMEGFSQQALDAALL